MLETLLSRLAMLPHGVRRADAAVPFRNNIEFLAAHDLFTGATANSPSDLSAYDQRALDQEAALWRDAGSRINWRWLTPARLLREKDKRKGLRGERRYCHDAEHVSADLLLSRLYDGVADLLRRRGLTPPARGEPPPATLAATRLFWLDSSYTDEQGNEQVMGGISGVLTLDLPEDIDDAWLCLMVLGQHIGVGQRRAFGWGRYRLETADGEITSVRAQPTTTVLERAARPENMIAAYQAILENRRQRRRADGSAPDDPGSMFDDGEDVDQDPPLDDLERLSERLNSTEYRPPALTGYVTQDRDGDLRALAVPPFMDRVAQRAVAQLITPAVEPFMSSGSHGYRRGRSRITAKTAIQSAFRDGYRWVFESDIDDFFDSVNREHLEVGCGRCTGTTRPWRSSWPG